MSNDSQGHQDSSEGYEDPALSRCGMDAGIRPAIKPVQSPDWLAPFIIGMGLGAFLFALGMLGMAWCGK